MLNVAEERNGTGPKSRGSKNMETRMASFRDSSNSSMSNCKVVGHEPAWYGRSWIMIVPRTTSRILDPTGVAAKKLEQRLGA
ncbi:hypothetical protein QLX08_000338 [Tetragonisca angustula]|uniref:Uncharacterized protein n=1 Tax=Tetragonisca angustula TaxID=166442 RepID=A0AAW1AK98_9HYME